MPQGVPRQVGCNASSRYSLSLLWEEGESESDAMRILRGPKARRNHEVSHI